MKKIIFTIIYFAAAAQLFSSTEILLKENFENPDKNEILNVAKFGSVSLKEVVGDSAIAGNASLEIDASVERGWTSLVKIPLTSKGNYKFTVKCKILENPRNANVYVAMRQMTNGEKNRVSLKKLSNKKQAQTVSVGGVIFNEGELEIISNDGIKIAIDDILIEKFSAPTKGAWMFEENAFIGMRYEPTNFDFCGFDAPFLNYSKDEFFPFIDRFGQFKHKDWEGKIHSVEDFKKRIEEEKKIYRKIGNISKRDKYFGLIDPDRKYEATGRFRTQKIDGKWWLITPDGNLFYSFGITCAGNIDSTPITDREFYFEDLSDARFLRKNQYGLHYYKKKHDSYSFLERNLVEKYGENYRDVYGEVTDERMRKWGFTTYGCWTQPYILRRGNIPYTAMTNSGKKMPYKTDVEMYAYWHAFPDVFTPGFRESTFNSIAKNADLLRSPACVGVFVDNEIPWQFKTLTTIRALLGCNADQPGKIEFMGDLKKKYGTIENLNKAWKSTYKDWNDFLSRKDFSPDTKAGTADMLAFEEKMYVLYFETCRAAVKAVSPDVLYLGCRFAWRNPLVEKIASRYCDVISYNVYTDNITKFSSVKGCEDKPIIIGEFHFGNTDKGVYGGGLNSRCTVKERKQAFEEYSISAFENPKVVGAHWFQWFDLCTTGRFNEANYAIGFVDICDTPDYVISKASRKLSQKMYKLRLAGKQSTVQSMEKGKAVIDD